MALHSLSLFSGIRGLDIAVERVFGPARTVCYVERDAYPAALLVAQMEAHYLAPAPVWSDVATFDGLPWRGVVDCVTGGFPCTDISDAGQRAGIDGEASGLWREMARIIREVEPRMVVVENVAALVSRGLDRVLGDLAAMGFDAEWGVLRASDVGAPHRRERIFVLAHADEHGQPEQRERGLREDGDAQSGDDADRRGCADAPLAHADDAGRGEPAWRESRDAQHAAAERGGAAPFPPGPDDADGWRAYLERYPGTEPAVRRGADGSRYRIDRLRALGNAVVPQQAEEALMRLVRR